MRMVVLGGAGAMGRVTVRDLSCSSPVEQVVIADVSLERAEKLRRQLGSEKIKSAYCDLNNRTNLLDVLKGATAVINCSPYTFNLQVMEVALEAGCHYLDLGGLFHVTRKQMELDKKFAERDLLAVLGMGGAPGMTNVMAAHAAHELDTIDAVEMVVAGVNLIPSRHPFMPPYALDTILDEYALEPMVFDDGRFVAMPPMSGEELVSMPEPIGKVRAFLTLHSEIATLPLVFASKGIRRVTYKLGLPAQFHERAKFLVELGFAGSTAMRFSDSASISPRAVLARMIEEHPLSHEAAPEQELDDYDCLRVDVRGARGGRPLTVRMESLVHCKREWKSDSGALDTGVPPSIVAQMIGLNVIQDRGVKAPEQCVPTELFFVELGKRGIPMRRISEEMLVSVVTECSAPHKA